jgi:23S rRNA pseudouridine2605 synthase
VASRRSADNLIVSGKVMVNDKPVTEKGVIIDESRDIVKVDGKVCSIPTDYIYVMLNKPEDYLVTLEDDFGRQTVADLVKAVPRRIYPIGRLDYDSEGLLLLTDDGDLAYRLAHPSFNVRKVYTVGVRGEFPDDRLSRFEEGITLDDGHIAHARVRVMKRSAKFTVLSIELTEGRKREIKRMCKAIGFAVRSIRRVQYDTLSLGNLERGRWRYLTPDEITRLKRCVDLA